MDAGKIAIRALEAATGAEVPAPGATVAPCGAIPAAVATNALVAAGAPA